MEIWIQKIGIVILVSIGVGLFSASLEPPTGPRKPGYSINPYLAGGGAGLITISFLIGGGAVKRKQKPKVEDEKEEVEENRIPHKQKERR